MHPLRAFLALSAIVSLAACSRHANQPRPLAVARPPARLLAPGVTYRQYPEGDPLTPATEAHVLDIDLRSPGVGIKIVADRMEMAKGRLYGDCYTVMDWCRRTGAIGGVNGGFFGTTDGRKKEVIGLLATEGEILASGRLVRSHNSPDQRFVRCVFGVTPEGVPKIGWAVGQRGRGALLTDYAAPVNPASQTYWQAACAVACGPRLLKGGSVNVTDRDERLVSPPALRRTFVAFDIENGKPRHLALGIGTAMTFQDAAAFLQRYFRETHGTANAEAMCLDGGSSTQMAYRVPTGYADVRPTSVTVPTAILIVPRP